VSKIKRFRPYKVAQKAVDNVAKYAYNNIIIMLKGGMAINIRPSVAICLNSDEIAENCQSSTRREKMRQLRESLLAVEEDRAADRKGCTIDELDSFLDGLLNGC